PVGGLTGDAALAAWLLEPWTKGFSLQQQVLRRLGEDLPAPDANQLVPETEPLGPASEAWYIGRLETAAREALDEGSQSVYADIELPLVPVIARMELAGIAIDATKLAGIRAEL